MAHLKSNLRVHQDLEAQKYLRRATQESVLVKPGLRAAALKHQVYSLTSACSSV